MIAGLLTYFLFFSGTPEVGPKAPPQIREVKSPDVDEIGDLTEPAAILAALETGKEQGWREAGRSGRVDVTTVADGDARPCRDYSVLDGAKRSGVSRACREADGNWRPMQQGHPEIDTE